MFKRRQMTAVWSAHSFERLAGFQWHFTYRQRSYTMTQRCYDVPQPKPLLAITSIDGTTFDSGRRSDAYFSLKE